MSTINGIGPSVSPDTYEAGVLKIVNTIKDEGPYLGPLTYQVGVDEIVAAIASNDLAVGGVAEELVALAAINSAGFAALEASMVAQTTSIVASQTAINGTIAGIGDSILQAISKSNTIMSDFFNKSLPAPLLTATMYTASLMVGSLSLGTTTIQLLGDNFSYVFPVMRGFYYRLVGFTIGMYRIQIEGDNALYLVNGLLNLVARTDSGASFKIVIHNNTILSHSGENALVKRH